MDVFFSVNIFKEYGNSAPIFATISTKDGKFNYTGLK